MSLDALSSTILRPPAAADIEPCARIIYRAFSDIAARHNFPPDIPSVEAALGMAGMLIGNPTVFGVVAEQGGVVVGSNFLFEGDPIRAVGPITVDPSAQGGGIGRRLMEAVLEQGRNAVGVRLLQDSFNTCSMSLYTSLGFEAKEPVVVLHGRPKSGARFVSGSVVRPFDLADLDACAALCLRIHGFDRASELRNARPPVQPWVLTRDGQLRAYATSLHTWHMAHGVAETDEDLEALILGVAAQRPEPLSFLLPIRQAALFRWCLSEGLRVVKPMTLMAIGAYQEPRGSWFPSVFY